jgi:thiol-disulfide isomerase/thioredoxin
VVHTLEGRTIRLSELTKGKPTLLEFWATWCPLCRKLEPTMAAAQARHGNRVVFVSVGVRDQQTPEGQRAYVREHKLGGEFVFDRDGEAVKAFQVPHTSFVIVVDADGKVAYTGVGADQDLEAAIGLLQADGDGRMRPRRP